MQAAAQDWDTLAGGMAGVLEKEARERASNRDAIAALRRRSFTAASSSNKGNAAPTGSSGTRSTPLAAPAAAAAAAAAAGGGKGAPKGHHLAKRPERRVRRLRSLPGSSTSSQRPPGLFPLRRRDTGGGGVINDFSGTSRNVTVSGVNPPPSSFSRDVSGGGGGGGGSAGSGSAGSGAGSAGSGDGGGGGLKAGAGMAAALWPSGGGGGTWASGRRPGRIGRAVPSGVTMTDAIPARLSCGYCRKVVRVETLDRHEDRCPSRNPDLFATPCAACGLQGPRCACWALRNGLLKETRTEPEKPLFTLFKNGDRQTPKSRRTATPTTATADASTKKAAGFLGGWEAGEGIRRPVTLMDEGYGSDDADGDGGESGRKMRGGGGGTTTAETPEERWMRERDDWLFGRSKDTASGGRPPTPPPPRAPACGGGGGGPGEEGGQEDRDEEQQQGAEASFAEESDEAFLLRERVQIRSHLEKVRDAAKVRRYTEKWFRFSSDPPEKIRHGDVPWLPRLSTLGLGEAGVDMLGAACRDGSRGDWRGGGGLQCERFETLGVNERDSPDVKKAALRAASLRWHPDKFMSKYGSRIAGEDRASISKDVQTTMERITKLRERLHQQQQANAAAHQGRLMAPTPADV